MTSTQPRQLSPSASGQRDEAQTETLTLEDLIASIGKGPRLGSDDIATNYDSDNEFLAGLKVRNNGTSPE